MSDNNNLNNTNRNYRDENKEVRSNESLTTSSQTESESVNTIESNSIPSTSLVRHDITLLHVMQRTFPIELVDHSLFLHDMPYSCWANSNQEDSDHDRLDLSRIISEVIMLTDTDSIMPLCDTNWYSLDEGISRQDTPHRPPRTN
jgi:hypothetical protein